MAEKDKERIRIDLNQFKLHIKIEHKIELSLHFDSPSRRFYLSLMAFVVTEMQKLGRITSIPLEEHYELLALLNETVGGSAGSSEKEHLLPRIYKKWKGALPDLEDAPLFRVMGKKKEFDNGIVRTYQFSEEEKDYWANLFEYKGSGEHVRLRLSIDTLGVGLYDAVVVYGEDPELRNADAWERFIASCKQEVENKPKPERAYHVFMKEPVTPVSPLKRWGIALPRRWKWAAMAAVILLVAGGVAFAVWKHYFYPPQAEVASVEKAAFPLPDKPSIAVLPFDNLSGDPEQEYFSDGMTDDLITDLSKISGLFVITRNSVFQYKGKPVDVKRISSELGVRYVLEGSVRRAEGKVRINAQLIDATTGGHLWAERYDGSLRDVFALQDRITGKIVAALAVKLTAGEEVYVGHKETSNIAAYDSFLQGWAHYIRCTPDDYAKAIPYFEKAVELDPNYGRAHAALASIYWESFYRIWHASLGVSWRETKLRADMYLKTAMESPTPLAYLVASKMLIGSFEHEKASAKAEQAMSLDPNDANSYIAMAYTLIYAGRPNEAFGFIQKAMRLDPQYPAYYLFVLGLAHFGMDRFEEAATSFERALTRNPENYVPMIPLAAAYAHLNREQDATATIEKLRKVLPMVTVSFVKGCPLWSYKNPADKTRLLDGLQKAGLPKSVYDALRKTD